MSALRKHPDVGGFLHDPHIRIPSTYTPDQRHLMLEFDVDGVVVELQTLVAVKLHVPYLNQHQAPLPPPPG